MTRCNVQIKKSCDSGGGCYIRSKTHDVKKFKGETMRRGRFQYRDGPKLPKHLPGRTDNEIKNYWRTRVQKHANHLKCNPNTKQFKDAMLHLWIRFRAASATPSGSHHNPTTTHQNLTDRQACLPTPAHSNMGATSDFRDSDFHGNETNLQTAEVSSLESLTSPSGYFNHGKTWGFGGNADTWGSTWNMEEFGISQQQQ